MTGSLLTTINDIIHRGSSTRLILALMMGLLAISLADGAIEQQRTVHASEITHAIKAGQTADFDNCTIVDDGSVANFL